LKECLKLNPMLLLNIDTQNEELIFLCIEKQPNLLKSIYFPKETFIKFFERGIQIPLEFINSDFFMDSNFVELYLKKTVFLEYPSKLKFHESILENRNLLKLILKKIPIYLSKLNENQRNDRELVEIAVRSNGIALMCASEELMNDRFLVLDAIESAKNPKQIFENMSDNLKEDRLVMLEAVKRASFAFFFASEDLQLDLKFVVDSSNYNRSVLKYIDVSFQKDIDIQMIFEGMYHKLRLKNEKISSFSDMHFNYVKI